MIDNGAIKSRQLLEKGDYENIFQLLLQEPNNLTILYNAGLAYEAINKIENAVSCWKRALDIKEDPSVIRSLAAAYSKSMHTIEKAIVMYEFLEEQDFAVSQDLVGLAECYMRCGKFETAHDCFVHAIDLDPDNMKAYIGAATLQARWTLKYFKEAVKHGVLEVDKLPECEPEVRFLIMTLAKLSIPKQEPEAPTLKVLD